MEKKQLYNTIIVLGCGESIKSLTKEEIEYINNCKIRIAINKFMGFYDLTPLKPNYVYFHDEMDNSFYMFKYILEKCKKNNLTNLTFFTNPHFKGLSSKYGLLYLLYLKLRSGIKWYILKRKSWTADQLYLRLPFKKIQCPKSSKIITVKLETYDKGDNWAQNIHEKLFNYKGSLSSILNLCSILSPNTPIYLVGNDFNGSKYFFQEELNKLTFPTHDFSTQIIQKYNRHMSFIANNDGKTFSDKIPDIINHLSKTKNELYCINPDSLLVTQGNIKYKKLPI